VSIKTFFVYQKNCLHLSLVQNVLTGGARFRCP